jgi:hypothetical protein
MRCRLAGHAELTLPSNSLFHNEPLGVTALRRSSREIVEGNRPCCRAISRTPHRWGFIAQFPPARQTPGSVPNAGSNLSVGCRPPLETIVGPTAAPRHMPTQPPHFAPPPGDVLPERLFRLQWVDTRPAKRWHQYSLCGFLWPRPQGTVRQYVHPIEWNGNTLRPQLCLSRAKFNIGLQLFQQGDSRVRPRPQ